VLKSSEELKMALLTELLNQLTPYGSYAYALIFLLLIACGFGLPMPEDIILITGGILAARGVCDFSLVVAASMVGVLLGDGIVFSIGSHFGPSFKTTRVYKRILPSKRELAVQGWFSRHGEKVIFFARFAPGLRTPLFLTAGIYGVPLWKFVALDGFAATISVPVWVWVGYLFGTNLEVLAERLGQLQYGMFDIVGGLLLLIIAGYYIKKKLFKV
jgi:membrane protein DedA with SNARE-associated domain